MPPPMRPAPPELDAVRAAADDLAEAEQRVEQLRAARDRAMIAAKQAGATGDQLAAAAGITRRNVYGALRAGGLDLSG